MENDKQTIPPNLLGLPREIRDNIYGFIISDFPLPRKVDCWPYPDYLYDAAHSPQVYDTTRDIMERPILQTCRQTRSEAYAVMVEKQQLIRVSVDNVLLSPHLIGAMLHVVPMTDRALEAYPGFVMTHSIAGEQDPDAQEGTTTTTMATRPWSFALPHRDLGMFCRAVSGGHVFSLDAGAPIRHRVVVHDPFRGNASPGFTSADNQTRLLQPYLDHLGWSAGFSITGSVDGGLAAEVAAEVRKMPQVDLAGRALDRHTREGADGQRHVVGGARRTGLARFSRACLGALAEAGRMAAADTDAWLGPGPGGRPNRHVRAVRDMFDMLSREHGAARWAPGAGAGRGREDHTWHLARAVQAAASLLSGRAPSPAQRSSAYFLSARAHRYLSGSPAAAEAMIRLALGVVAGEAFDDWKEQCLEEGQEIARWREMRSGM